MTVNGWLQIAVTLCLVLLTVKPLGVWMTRVFAGEVYFLAPVERRFYRWAGIDPNKDQHWTAYGFSMLGFSAVCFVGLYLLLRWQDLFPLNPANQPAVPPDLAFNTATSFVTNTNWQSYAGESTMSHFSQMAGLTVQNFISAAVGICLAVTLIRGFARASSKGLGNFWADLVRCTLYILLPMSVVIAIVFVAFGVPQNFAAPVEAHTLQGATQLIAQGPVASQEAIKMLGTNGGGFFNANSAHPYENPSAFTNLIQMWAIFSLGAALTYVFGRMVKNQRQGWTILAAMMVLVVAGIAGVYAAESAGNPHFATLGLDSTANWEGKETRFGMAATAIFSVMTTAASCGAVNGMFDSFTPLGGLVPMFNIQLGEIIVGGVGSGLYGMLLFAILAIFIAGLMVGRTPEYVGKKIEAKEVKLTMLAILVLPLSILGLTALASVLPSATDSLANHGPHGFSELLYAYTSGTGNNGSAFAGLNANTPFFNMTIGLAMLIGRFLMIVPMLAIAGSLAAKKVVPPSAGTFPTTGGLWVGLLIGTILIVGGLVFFPALALGPIVEHLSMQAGTLW
ncbi:MAG: potassium-transporting ATPase subunit KdpA [Rhodospirillales bacterium]